MLYYCCFGWAVAQLHWETQLGDSSQRSAKQTICTANNEKWSDRMQNAEYMQKVHAQAAQGLRVACYEQLCDVFLGRGLTRLSRRHFESPTPKDIQSKSPRNHWPHGLVGGKTFSAEAR